jgi:SAM-dependent methyltransferase
MIDHLRRHVLGINHRLYLRKQPRSRKKLRAGLALHKLLAEYDFSTVLDIGSGGGDHAAIMAEAGKQVTAIDYGTSYYYRKGATNLQVTIGDFAKHGFERQFDCVWCSHVLEHQLNVQSFLIKVKDALRPDGILAITVPPLKHTIAGGHVSLWNGGLLLYRLVLAGFDCSEARILRYGNNVSALLRKREIDVLGEIEYDRGDLRKIRKFLPASLPYATRDEVDDPFDGNILRLNW